MSLRKLFGRDQRRETTSRVTVRNYTRHPLQVIFEPWCYTLELAPDAERVFEATSTRPGWLEVEYSDDAATVYAWDACVARVLNPDGTVIESLDIRVPDFAALDEAAARDRDAAV